MDYNYFKRPNRFLASDLKVYLILWFWNFKFGVMDTANNNILSIKLLLLFWVWEDSTVKLIVGGFTVIWISRQLYVSFKKERREEHEEHELKIWQFCGNN